jgi:hypothetical protein
MTGLLSFLLDQGIKIFFSIFFVAIVGFCANLIGIFFYFLKDGFWVGFLCHLFLG